MFILLLHPHSVRFKYTCVVVSTLPKKEKKKAGENVILIQRSNSQCNHREYAINWESLQSIARRVYSYTSFTVSSSLRTLSLLQLPPLYFSSVLFSFVKYLLHSPPPRLTPSFTGKKKKKAHSSLPPLLLALQIISYLITSHHPPASLLHPPHSPALPSPLQCFSSPATAPMLSHSFHHYHHPLLPICLLSLHPRSPLPPPPQHSLSRWHPNLQVLVSCFPLTCFRFSLPKNRKRPLPKNKKTNPQTVLMLPRHGRCWFARY